VKLDEQGAEIQNGILAPANYDSKGESRVLFLQRPEMGD
jgi:hypothetical protein